MINYDDNLVKTDWGLKETVYPKTYGELNRVVIELIKKANDIDVLILQRNKTYAVGDIAYHKDLPSWARLECVQAGTTGDSISLSSITKAGELVPDGTAVWIIDDVRDGHRVGDILMRYTLRDGFIKLNGATVLRADYPRLVQWVDDNNLWTADESALGLFGVGDSLTTMRLPDFRNRFIEGVDSNGGVVVGAGVPNIIGQINSVLIDYAISISGAFSTSYTYAQNLAGSEDTSPQYGANIQFKASKSNSLYGNSNTVQPAAVRLIAQIKY